MNKPFDLTKPCQTRDGSPVRILCTDGPDLRYPIVGIVQNEICIRIWKSDGLLGLRESPNDLINIPEPPKLRPWKPEEVPVGALLRDKSWHKACVSQIIGKTASGLVLFYSVGESRQPLRTIFEGSFLDYEHSTDHGKTWHPCGVIEL